MNRQRYLGCAATAAASCAGYYSLLGPTSQVMGTFPYRGHTDEKVVALTFDDGPNEPHTSRLVNLLDDKGVVATFFQVGVCVQRHPGLSKRMISAGHVVGNHSHTHRLSQYLVDPRLRSEISRTQDVLAKELGRVPGLFRPPWLVHPRPLLEEVRRQGLQVVSGTFAHPLEVAQPPAWRIARYAIARIRPGTILIFHDGFDARGGYRGETVRAAGMVIDALQTRGFRFTTVDELLHAPAYLTKLATHPGQGGQGM